MLALEEGHLASEASQGQAVVQASLPSLRRAHGVQPRPGAEGGARRRHHHHPDAAHHVPPERGHVDRVVHVHAALEIPVDAASQAAAHAQRKRPASATKELGHVSARLRLCQEGLQLQHGGAAVKRRR
eukprot:278297-Lingulodinium_polyedra.AAC.1